MPISFYDSITFRFNGGRGISIDQIAGSLVTGVSPDGTAVIVRQADGTVRNLVVGGLSEDDRNLLRNAVQRVLVGVEQGSAETVDKIVLRGGKGYLTESVVIREATPATAAFENFADSHFWGYRTGDPPASSASESQWYFNTLSHRARILININPVGPGGPAYDWTDASLDQIIPGAGVYQHEWPNDAEAAKHIRRIGDVYFNTSVGALRRSTAYTPAAGQVLGNRLTRLLTEKDLVDSHGDGNVRVFQETAGTAEAITLASKSGEALTEYGDKLILVFKAAQDVPAAATLSADGLTAYPLRNGSGAALTDDLIPGGEWVAAIFNRAANTFDCFGVKSGGDVDAVARAAAAVNKAILGRMSVFETYAIEPAGIPGNDFPEFLALTLSTKLVDKTITRIRVSVSGQVAADLNQNLNPTPPATDLAAPFNNGVARISGGVVNLRLGAAARLNLKNAIGTSTQFIEVGIEYTFSDGTTAFDRGHFGVNNNAFRAITAKVRFEQAVGASPAVLPVGSYEVSARIKQSGNPRIGIKRILLSDIPAADERFWVRLNAQHDASLTMRYTPATRTLTYSPSSGDEATLKVIGEV